jgi:O-antigen/teichoic acid export membrane protein
VNLAVNIMTTLAARIVLMALALGSSILLARSLGPEGRGLFALVLLLPELARTLAMLGFDQSNAVYAGLEPRMRPALVWQSVALAVVVGGALALAGSGYLALGAPGTPNLVQGPLWLYVVPLVALPAALIVEYWHAILRGMNRIVTQNVVDVGMRAAGVLLLVGLLAAGRLDVTTAVVANVTISVIAVIVLGSLLQSAGSLGAPTFDRPVWRRSARFALPAYGGNVAAFLTYRAGEFIIAAFLPATQLGFYVLAVGLVERLWVLPGAVSTALLPHLTNSRDRDPVLAAAIARHVCLWVGLACVLLFAGAGWIVEVLFSSEFAEATTPLRWLLPGIFTLSIAKIVLAEVIAREKPHFPSLASGVAVVVNVAMNLALVPHIGITGAAIASSVSYTILAAMWIWYYLRETRVSWRELVPSPSDLLFYAAFFRRRGRAGAVAAP